MWNHRPLNLTIIEDYRGPDGGSELTLSKSNLQQSQIYRTIAIFEAYHFGYDQVEIQANGENKLFALVVHMDGEIMELSEKEIFHSGYLTSQAVSEMSAKQKTHFLDNVCYMKICALRQKHLALW